jgi:hypothetical protein
VTTRYIVLEHADDVDERVFPDFRTLDEAREWMRDAYDPDEIERCNVRIAKEIDGERVYKFKDARYCCSPSM